MTVIVEETTTELGVETQNLTLLTLYQQGPRGANGQDGAPGDIGMDPGDLILYFIAGLT